VVEWTIEDIDDMTNEDALEVYKKLAVVINEKEKKPKATTKKLALVSQKSSKK
jgi:hypothetical protein